MLTWPLWARAALQVSVLRREFARPSTCLTGFKTSIEGGRRALQPGPAMPPGVREHHWLAPAPD
jgi:hypothetical protein